MHNFIHVYTGPWDAWMVATVITGSILGASLFLMLLILILMMKRKSHKSRSLESNDESSYETSRPYTIPRVHRVWKKDKFIEGTASSGDSLYKGFFGGVHFNDRYIEDEVDTLQTNATWTDGRTIEHRRINNVNIVS